MTDLSAILERWCVHHGVPGAQLSVRRNGVGADAVFGVSNLASRDVVTPQTRFQIGSVTKPLLAFAAFRLAEADLLDLDAPPSAYLDDLSADAPLASRGLKIRHLLDHSSGLSGDVFLDLGDDLSAAARLLKAAETAPVMHAAGQEASYCNFGYVALGEIIAQAAGRPWPAVFQEHVNDTLGSETLDPWPPSSATGLAVGHQAGAPVERTHLAISNAAAGTTPVGAAADLSRFGSALLDALAGRGPISQDSAGAMTRLSARLAPNERGDGFGQGCMVMDWNGAHVFGHDGLTIGQRAFLRVFPASGASVGLLGNGGDLRGLYQDVMTELAAVTGARPPPRLSAIGQDDGREDICGRYDRLNASLRVTRADGTLQVEILNHEPWAEFAYGAVEGPFPLNPCGPDRYMLVKPGSDVPLMVSFGDGAAWHGMRRYNAALKAE